ncbi:MAG: hypothetical protein PVJ86_00535 [Phycisphaerales bacterium]|jgi:hypothetical protein
MAVSTNAIRLTAPHQKVVSRSVTRWAVNASSADASACEEIKASPGSGNKLVVERLVVGIGAAITVTIGSGEANGAVGGDKIGPLGGAAGTYLLDFGPDDAYELIAAKSLTFDASGAGTVAIAAIGYTVDTGNEDIDQFESIAVTESVTLSIV